MELQRTALYKLCLEAGARMVPFSGWEMPVQFSSLINEHQAVREKVGVFDISHMGVFEIKGRRPKDALQQLVPTDLYRIGEGEACYTVLLNPKGGIIDDLIIYDCGSDEKEDATLLVVINAGCTNNDISWFKQHLDLKKIQILDTFRDSIFLAVQGPSSQSLIEELIGQSLSNMPRFGHRQININGNESIFISRTGYTGENGYELLMQKAIGQKVWMQLIEKGVTPCGLGARDTLRLEAALHLYGNDMDAQTTPFEAGLAWLVHLEIPTNFIGREALEKQAKAGAINSLVGLKLAGRGIARHGYPVIHESKTIGKVTSGTWSPTLKEPIALAYVPSKLAKIGTKLEVEIRNQNFPATVVRKPFYRRS